MEGHARNPERILGELVKSHPPTPGAGVSETAVVTRETALTHRAYKDAMNEQSRSGFDSYFFVKIRIPLSGGFRLHDRCVQYPAKSHVPIG